MTTQSSKLGKELKGMIKGNVLIADDPGYEEARQIWNAMIDKWPALIVQCASAADVVHAAGGSGIHPRQRPASRSRVPPAHERGHAQGRRHPAIGARHPLHQLHLRLQHPVADEQPPERRRLRPARTLR